MKFDTHLCLVSAQATPTIVPTLDRNFRPHCVVLAVSPDMRERAKWIETVLKRHGMEVNLLEIVDPYDYHRCWINFADWLTGCAGNVALNVTGGTKVMAMAAQDVFREEKKPVFYINVENDQAIRLDGRRTTPVTLSIKMKLTEYLEAHGYSTPAKLAKPSIEADIRDLINRLGYGSGRLGHAMGKLNWLSQQAVETLRTQSLDNHDLDSKSLTELISEFENIGMLQLRDNRLIFPDEDARRFVSGGWLELLVYQTLAKLSPEIGISDYAISINVLSPDKKTRNELDAAFLFRNKLHIIECKSGNLTGSGTEALYKLDSLRRMGGLRTRAVLVDFRNSLNDADKRRASHMDLHVISGSELRDLPGALKGWLLK